MSEWLFIPWTVVCLQVGSLLKVLSLLAAASIKDVHPSHVFGPHPTWALAATSASGMYRSRSENSGSKSSCSGGTLTRVRGGMGVLQGGCCYEGVGPRTRQRQRKRRCQSRSWRPGGRSSCGD